MCILVSKLEETLSKCRPDSRVKWERFLSCGGVKRLLQGQTLQEAVTHHIQVCLPFLPWLSCSLLHFQSRPVTLMMHSTCSRHTKMALFAQILLREADGRGLIRWASLYHSEPLCGHMKVQYTNPGQWPGKFSIIYFCLTTGSIPRSLMEILHITTICSL